MEQVHEVELHKMEKDKTDRRSGIDRRSYQFAVHIPEWRSGKDRGVAEIEKNSIRKKLMINHF